MRMMSMKKETMKGKTKKKGIKMSRRCNMRKKQIKKMK
eukprot:CAMPEP_0170552718 /NCGR_PEP_ID=MMETSP0211-20121228/10604_1 /TAXON_ID=311385 /ORGANISM="Pseudokeronopsis sp., Strain OXSARD2" /LENGTH=37 /DNA_ID= /DNA_START= /DNA_END= /DNA_ORIENTATION=